jgi:YVTN family beta-propeller protein
MMQLTPDGRRIWVSNRNRGTVSVIDAQTGRVLRRIRVGRSPHGLTYFPQQGRFSIGHNGLYR